MAMRFCWIEMKPLAAVPVLALVLLASGCSEFKKGWDEGINQADYTDSMKANYLATCSAEAVKNVSAEQARTYCECTFERVSSTIPVAEWVRLDSGDPVQPETTSSLKVAIAQCGGNPAALSE